PVSFVQQSKKLPKSATGPEGHTRGTLGVSRLTSFVFGPNQERRTQELSVQTCGSLVQKNSEIIVATRPTIPSRPVTTNVEGKAGLYQSARKEVVCGERADALQQLAEFYTAWDQSADAVHALDKARNEGAHSSSDP